MSVNSQGIYKEVEFSLMAQAIVTTPSPHKVFGYELTVRPTGGNSAHELIKHAVDFHEKVDLDIAIIQAIQKIESQPTLSKPQNLWINLFPSTLASPSAVGVICEMISGSRHNIVIEITENEFITDYRDMQDSVSKLKAAGAAVVMDDFGAGAASLKPLLELPLDGIKLDLEVFQKAVAEPRFLPLIEGLVRTASNLKVPVIAEGIETQYQLKMAGILGIDYVQGYYLGRPEALPVTPKRQELREGLAIKPEPAQAWRPPANDDTPTICPTRFKVY